MNRQFETKLRSPQGLVDGVVTEKNADGTAWEFKSIDGTLHLVIARDEEGEWQRIGGTEPYLSSWIDELAAKVE